jgi:ketosteroid isomerase-like protein
MSIGNFHRPQGDLIMSAAILNPPFNTHQAQNQAQDEAQILALIEAVRQAHHAKDAAGIAAPYAPHAVIYDLEPPLSHDGISIERKRKWLDTWDSPLELAAQDFKVVISGDHAYGYGYLRLAGKKKGVDQPVSFWMRATTCFERANGAWRIVHEHHSVPFYMDGSLRPAFDLKP